MNLFARSIGVPLDLDEAVRALAAAETRAVDICTANGRPFVHQYSLGLQPRTIRLRDSLKPGGKVGKVLASTRAMMRTLARPGRVEVVAAIGEEQVKGRFGFVTVSNNLYGEGHMPYAGDPAGGVLAVYRAPMLGLWRNAALAFRLLRGAWRESPDLAVSTGNTVELRVAGKTRPKKASIDGEIVELENVVKFELHHKALNVLSPDQANRSIFPSLSA